MDELLDVVVDPASFFDGVDEQIYWFPAEMVVDPLTGAVDYVPLT